MISITIPFSIARESIFRSTVDHFWPALPRVSQGYFANQIKFKIITLVRNFSWA